jgi:hypothetical protein
MKKQKLMEEDWLQSRAMGLLRQNHSFQQHFFI